MASGTGPFGYPGEVAPTGGTSTSGGIHGHINFSDGNDGSGPAAGGQAGRGGDGGGSNIDSWWVGGGGGGGYYGGGGGAYTQAGGGGSGYADASVTDLVSTDGANGGNGVVSISWDILPQTVTFTSSAPASAVAGSTLAVTATGGASGNPVTLSVDPSTTNAACSITGWTVSFDHAGTCVVDADQAGNLQYASAVTAQQSILVTTVPSAVSLTSTPTVFGQAIRVNATVGNGGGTPAGTVQFAVDGDDIGSPVALVGGSAVSPALTTAGGASLAAGGHAVTASYSPADPTVYAGSTAATTHVVNQASTTTAVKVRASSISATVSPVAPGSGLPSGTVTFRVAGRSVGTANVVNGVGTLSYRVPTVTTQAIAAIYSGDDSFTASSASTSRSNPSITATVTSAQPKSRSGWYRTPVTVTFQCTTHGAPLAAPCPRPVQLKANGAAQSATRTITAADGGVATLSVGGINLDRSAPSVKVTGIKNGAGYGGEAPVARCVAKDGLSGVASCKITRHKRGSLTSYRATATDSAGNTTTAHGSYRVLSIYVQGAPYSAGAFTVRAGHSYTVVVTGQAERPTYYDAAVYPYKPTQADMAFFAAGHHRWALGVTGRPGHAQPCALVPGRQDRAHDAPVEGPRHQLTQRVRLGAAPDLQRCGAGAARRTG